MNIVLKQGVILTMLGLVLLGTGCVSTPVSTHTPEEATLSLSFDVGDQIELRPTILGVGGSVVGWLGGAEDSREVTLREWIAGEKVDLVWKITSRIETEESKRMRVEYDAVYAHSPVGVEIPPVPETLYEDKVENGSIRSESLAQGARLMLPQEWLAQDVGAVEETLIWLSRAQYKELAQTRSTALSLGLFDESLVKVEEASTQLKSVFDRISGLLSPILGESAQPSQTEESRTSLTHIQAESAWGEYVLLIDGVRTSVRVVQAKNAFASYKILANEQNPLILEIQLTPLSQGNLDLSKDGFTKGFGGYEVTQINHAK